MTMRPSPYNPEGPYNPDRRHQPEQDPQRVELPPSCDLCEGTGWVSFPDPFLNGALIEGRCPACRDLTVRAEKNRWESDDGRAVGPTGGLT